MTPLVLAAALAAATPADPAYRAALDLVYDGRFPEAQSRLQALAAAHPEDPVGPYLQALARCWVLEQQPESLAQDGEFLKLVDRALALAQGRGERDRLARGAAYGVRSRFDMFRGRRREAARDAVRMREELLPLAAQEESADALFGLGLYDYYTDVLPRFAKFFRFLSGMPGGDRARGLARIEQAKESTLFHDTEARAQLYEIYAYYEDGPDRAAGELEALQARYPGWPLWGLKLAEHLRERMGAYERSAEVARAILERAEAGSHPNYQRAVGAMARVSLGESLLADLRFAQARAVLSPLADGFAEAPALGSRARLAFGRSLELEGDRAGALAHYRASLAGPDRELRLAAQRALAREIPPEEIRAAPLLARARRLREGGRTREAAELYREALRTWPRGLEAALFVAEDDLESGRVSEARERVAALAREKVLSPPSLRPWVWWLQGRLHEVAGQRREALAAYQHVGAEPYGQNRLREHAEAAARRWDRP